MNKKLSIRNSTSKATGKVFLIVLQEGNRKVTRSMEYYNMVLNKQMEIIIGLEGKEK